MPVEEIVDSRDDRLAGYRDLTDVALRVAFEPANGVYIAESASVIERALDAGHEPFSTVHSVRHDTTTAAPTLAMLQAFETKSRD